VCYAFEMSEHARIPNPEQQERRADRMHVIMNTLAVIGLAGVMYGVVGTAAEHTVPETTAVGEVLNAEAMDQSYHIAGVAGIVALGASFGAMRIRDNLNSPRR